MMPFPADVSVAVICHNSRGKVLPTLESLERAGCPRAAISIIDVASTDQTAEWLAAEFPGVRIERLDRNDGPNPGRNLAIRRCPTHFLFLMDSDVRVQPDTIQRLR
jgi:glycosyltransferase involved in cell wall biosynthesis